MIKLIFCIVCLVIINLTLRFGFKFSPEDVKFWSLLIINSYIAVTLSDLVDWLRDKN